MYGKKLNEPCKANQTTIKFYNNFIETIGTEDFDRQVFCQHQKHFMVTKLSE